MITIKLESTEEFDKLNLPHDSTILTQLSTRYPEEFEKTINYMKEMMEDVYERRYDNILDVCSMAEIIEELDFMINPDPEKEILTSNDRKRNLQNDNRKRIPTKMRWAD